MIVGSGNFQYSVVEGWGQGPEGRHRISIFNLDGELLARWGEKGEAPGQFADSPHGIWVDSHGDLYVAEVPRLPDRLQKFARV